MKYTTVGQLKKMIKELDDKTEILFEVDEVELRDGPFTNSKKIKLPKSFSLGITTDLYKPKFEELSTDIDGSQTIWCKFKAVVSCG